MSTIVTITRYTTDEINEAFVNHLTDDTFKTEYQMTKAINATLRTLDLNKQVPPQMIYNYVSKGTVALSYGSVTTWLTNYINNNNHKW